MRRKYFPVQFSVLSSKSLEKEILSRYAIGGNFKCQFFTQGLNDIYVVKTSGDTYYLRISIFNWRTKEEINAEIELLNQLYKNGISVSKPVQDDYGNLIHDIIAPEGIRYAVLFTEAKGIKNDNPNQKQNFLLGNMVAQIHTYADKITLNNNRFDIDLRHLIDEPLKTIKPYMLHRVDDFEYLKHIGRQLRVFMKKTLSKSKPEYGICHGDMHHGNIHFDNDGTIMIFDFDCFGYGWRAYDIAVFLWHQQLNRSASEDEDSKQKQWESFLDGYNTVRHMNVNELNAIKVFVIIREIWLLGIHLGSLERNRGCDWLSDRYFDFHIKFIKKWLNKQKHILD